ncbi:MAG TPA: diacylglycerol kinase family protein [Geminicoccaceae bacterium]|nr:diacylglycerol kinase family protein [Geminicoccus sp.]HMU51205.1 diacylglycerol kinase family protein [Geminicoccaceae bacterium]
MRVGLISNARSERNKAGLHDLDAALASRPEVDHLHFDGSRPMAGLLRDLRGIGLLVVNGGDGTVQGALTALLEERPLDPLPPVAILPRGMANMTAADAGLRQRGAPVLDRLLRAASRGDLDRHLVERRILRVDGIRDWTAQCGMFFGAAGIYEAIRICKGQVHTLGLKGELSHGVTLAWLLLNAALRGLDAVGIHGHDIAVSADGAPPVVERRLLVLATTLDRLVLGSRPFWNTGGRPVRFTSIAYDAPGIVRHARRILYGGDAGRGLPAGFDSLGAERIELGLDGPFTIDGQFFEPTPGRPLVLTAPDTVRFVRL